MKKLQKPENETTEFAVGHERGVRLIKSYLCLQHEGHLNPGWEGLIQFQPKSSSASAMAMVSLFDRSDSEQGKLSNLEGFTYQSEDISTAKSDPRRENGHHHS